MSEPREIYEAAADALAENGYVQEAVEMLGKGYDNVVYDEAPRDYYSQIPNMVDDYGLSPHAYRLYGHLRRVAGEAGKCWQNTNTLANACDMSAGSVSKAKKELTETEFVPFIRVRKVPMKSGFSYDEITITDLWKLNHDIYAKTPVHIVNGSQYEQLVHNVKQRITLIKNNTKNGTNVPNASDYPIDWQLAGGLPITEVDQLRAQFRDSANLMDMGCAGAGALALAFMNARNILIPESKIKGNRKAAREMLEMHVKPEHVRQATLELVEKGMTVTDLFSVSKTAIDLANKPAEKEYVIQITEIEDWRKEIKL